MSISNIIDPLTRKIYPALIPAVPPPPLLVPNLNAVLTAGNSAGSQTIENLDDLETQKIYQGNYLQLELGELGDTVLLKGATPLGSLHVGNGLSIEKLPVGANGLVLKANSAQPLGVEWAVDGTNGITGVSAGANITINNINPLIPAISLSSPLTSSLNTGTQNVQGTSTQITLTNGGSQANIQANLGFTSVDGSVPTTKSVLFKTGLTVQTATQSVVVSPTSIVKSGTTPLSITSSQSQIVLQGSGGLSNGIQINQLAGQPTTLTTSLGNVKYYPDSYLTNNNLNSVGVPPPQTTYQRLTLNNLGLTNTNQWSDYGNNVFAGYSAFTSDVNGNIWLALQGSGEIQVWDITITTQLYTILLENGGNPKSVEVLKQFGNYMFIGGNFNSINGNATPQNGITRVSTIAYVEDPIYDTANSIYGINQNASVYAIEFDASNDTIFFGGNFSAFSNGNNSYRIATFNNAQQAGGVQTYTEIDGGVDNDVYAIHYDTSATFLYVGGAFENVQVNTGLPQNMKFGAVYYPASGAWQYPFCQNQLDAVVYVILPSASPQYLFVAGNFGNPSPLVGGPYSVYVEVVDAQNLYYDTLLTLATPPNQKQAYGLFGSYPPTVMNANIFFRESGFQIWTSLGTPTGAGSVTGINNFGGNWKVIYDNYGFVRSHQSLPHSCEFLGSFVYDALPYGKYIITTRNVSQQFIGDSGNTFWSIIGGGVGAFSN